MPERAPEPARGEARGTAWRAGRALLGACLLGRRPRRTGRGGDARPPASSCASCGPWQARSRAGTTTRATPASGAFGKYQIMPFNWPLWAAQYLGRRPRRPDALEPGEGGLRQDPRAVRLAGDLEARGLLVADRRHRGRRAALVGLCRGYVQDHHAPAPGARPDDGGAMPARTSSTLGPRRLAPRRGRVAAPPWRRRSRPGPGGAACAMARCSASTRPRRSGNGVALDRRRDPRRSSWLAAADEHAAGATARLERGHWRDVRARGHDAEPARPPHDASAAALRRRGHGRSPVAAAGGAQPTSTIR